MIRQHGRAPRPPRQPDFIEWSDQFQDFNRWQQCRHTDPTHPARAWDPDQVKAHVAVTWPALHQMDEWSKWHDGQPARQGTRWQLRSKTPTRSVAWLVVYVIALLWGAWQLQIATVDTDWWRALLAGLVIGVCVVSIIQRAAGLRNMLAERRPGAPTNREAKDAAYAEYLRTGEIRPLR